MIHLLRATALTTLTSLTLTGLSTTTAFAQTTPTIVEVSLSRVGNVYGQDDRTVVPQYSFIGKARAFMPDDTVNVCGGTLVKKENGNIVISDASHCNLDRGAIAVGGEVEFPFATIKYTKGQIKGNPLVGLNGEYRYDYAEIDIPDNPNLPTVPVFYDYIGPAFIIGNTVAHDADGKYISVITQTPFCDITMDTYEITGDCDSTSGTSGSGVFGIRDGELGLIGVLSHHVQSVTDYPDGRTVVVPERTIFARAVRLDQQYMAMVERETGATPVSQAPPVLLADYSISREEYVLAHTDDERLKELIRQGWSIKDYRFPGTDNP